MKDLVFIDIEANGLDPEKLKGITLAVTSSRQPDGSGPHRVQAWGGRRSGLPALCEEIGVEYAGDSGHLHDYLDGGSRQLVAHNGIGYDFPALSQLRVCPRTGHLDTLILSRMCFPDLWKTDEREKKIPKEFYGRHSIEAWGHRLGMHKGDFKGPWDVPTKEMLEYCIRDVEILMAFHALCEKHPANTERFREIEHRDAEINYLQERAGFCFDKACAERGVARLQKLRLAYETHLQTIFPPKYEEMKMPEYWSVRMGGSDASPTLLFFPSKKAAQEAGWKPKQIVRGPNRKKEIPFNPGSRQMICERLTEKYGWKPTQFTDNEKNPQPKMDEAVLAELDYPEAKVLANYFLVQKTLGQIAEGDSSWFQYISEDGRIHGRVNTLGARTTRKSHYSPNVAQVPGVDHRFGKKCRRCFTAREGWVLVGADASGLEARMLAHYMSYLDKGEYIKIVTEGDLHQANADAWGLSRYDAKAPFYAMLYGAGDSKMGKLVDGSAKKGRQLKEQFKRRFPAYAALLEAVQKKTKTHGYLIGLDGRRLISPGANSALNTLLQGGGATVMKYAKVAVYDTLTEAGLVHDQDYAFVADVHDEWQIESKPEHAQFIGETCVNSIRKAGEVLGVRCPLDGEFKIGKNWKETH